MAFFFNDTATTEIYTLSLHDALPILPLRRELGDEPPDVVVALPDDHGAEVLRHDLLRDEAVGVDGREGRLDRKSTRLNSSHANISYAVFCLKKKIPIISSLTFLYLFS